MLERRPPRETGVDALFRDVTAAGRDPARIREVLGQWDPDDNLLLSVLKRPLPPRFLEHLGTVPPWSERRRVLGGVAKSPRTPRGVALRVLPALYWRDLAEVAANLYLVPAVRVRAEGLLVEQLPDLRMGERVTLARLATPPVLMRLLVDEEPRVARAALLNPRLQERQLVECLRSLPVTARLPREVAACPRWAASYGVRLALVLQPRTPLAIALAQLTSLTPGDLRRVADTGNLPPLVQAAAERAARGRR